MEIRNKLLFTAILAFAMHAPAYADDAENDDQTTDVAAAPADSGPVVTGFAGHYLSGRFAQSNGDVSGAIRNLREAQSSNPENIEVTSQLQATLLLDGHIEEATGVARQLQKAGRKDAISSLLLSLTAIKSGDLPQASTLLLDADSETGQLWLPLVQGWLDVGQKKLTKPLTIDALGPDVGRAAPIVNYHLALINSAAGFKDAAAQNFKNAIQDPKNPPVRVMEALLQFYSQNDSPEVLTPIVNSYREANPDSALDEKGHVVASVPDGVAEVLFTMGSIMLSAEATQDSVIYLRLALYVRPGFGVAAVTLGDAYADLQQPAKSNEAYALVDPKSRFYTAAQLHIAMNIDHMGKTPEAIAMLDKMVKADPSRYEAIMAKGDIYREHNKFPEAIAAYSQALAQVQDPSQQWPILFARGVCYERMSKWQLSEKDLKQALDISPDQPEVLNYLGYSWLVRGEHLKEARDMIEKAVRARPNDAEIVDSMGWALYLMGEYDEASAYLEKALEAMPSDPTVNDHLGDIYWRQGRKTEARYQWERSLSFSPEPSLAATLRHKLKDGLPDAAPLAEKVPEVAEGQHSDNPTP